MMQNYFKRFIVNLIWLPVRVAISNLWTSASQELFLKINLGDLDVPPLKTKIVVTLRDYLEGD